MDVVQNELNHARFLELYQEFDLFIIQLHGLYLDSATGYRLIHEKLESEKAQVMDLFVGIRESDYLKSLYSHSSLIGEDFAASGIHQATYEDFVSRNRPEGQNYRQLGMLSVVTAYTYWECYLRREVGIALGVLSADEEDEDAIKSILKEKVRSDFWGDLGLLRNSILHKNGIASSKLRAAKIFKWFKPGEEIVLNELMMREIFLGQFRYRNDLHDLSLPKHKPRIIRLPQNKHNKSR